MSEESEKVKTVVSFKEKLEKRIGDLETELNDMKTMLTMVNSMLLEKSFKRAEVPMPSVKADEPIKSGSVPEVSEQPVECNPALENVIPLKTGTGELLALLQINEDSLRVLPAEDKSFTVDTPPFMNFLVERVLTKMQERDAELARAGELDTDQIFCYNIMREGDTIREITIKNVDAERLRELRSSIRWTFEKMLEKTKSQE